MCCVYSSMECFFCIIRTKSTTLINTNRRKKIVWSMLYKTEGEAIKVLMVEKSTLFSFAICNSKTNQP